VAASTASPTASAASTAASLDISGSNGTLAISEIRLIVAGFELEKAEGLCSASTDAAKDSTEVDRECPDFKAPPQFLDLPLDGKIEPIATAQMLPGTYSHLKFQVEDLSEDEEGDGKVISALRDTILAAFPDWPSKASVRVAGTFTDTAGVSTPFTVYAETEIEVEMKLTPPLIVSDAGVASREITVDVKPAGWFGNADGTVIDLSKYDFAVTGKVLEIEGGDRGFGDERESEGSDG